MGTPTPSGDGPKHQLPDYRPRGMTTIDRIAAWVFAFMLLIFLMVTVGHVVAAHVPSPAHPKATATATHKGHHHKVKGCKS